MKRTTITIPDDLDARIDEYLQTPDAPTSLSAVVQAALEAYLEKQEVHEARRPHTDRAEDAMVDLPRPLLFEEMTQEELDKVPRVLEITPAEKGSGLSDVSINHDKYLAEASFNDSFSSD